MGHIPKKPIPQILIPQHYTFSPIFYRCRKWSLPLFQSTWTSGKVNKKERRRIGGEVKGWDGGIRVAWNRTQSVHCRCWDLLFLLRPNNFDNNYYYPARDILICSNTQGKNPYFTLWVCWGLVWVKRYPSFTHFVNLYRRYDIKARDGPVPFT